jgi:hypothetical protein
MKVTDWVFVVRVLLDFSEVLIDVDRVVDKTEGVDVQVDESNREAL